VGGRGEVSLEWPANVSGERELQTCSGVSAPACRTMVWRAGLGGVVRRSDVNAQSTVGVAELFQSPTPRTLNITRTESLPKVFDFAPYRPAAMSVRPCLHHGSAFCACIKCLELNFVLISPLHWIRAFVIICWIRAFVIICCMVHWIKRITSMTTGFANLAISAVSVHSCVTGFGLYDLSVCRFCEFA